MAKENHLPCAHLAADRQGKFCGIKALRSGGACLCPYLTRKIDWVHNKGDISRPRLRMFKGGQGICQGFKETVTLILG